MKEKENKKRKEAPLAGGSVVTKEKQRGKLERTRNSLRGVPKKKEGESSLRGAEQQCSRERRREDAPLLQRK